MSTQIIASAAKPLKSPVLFAALALSLSGCLENNTQRGLAGAAGGAVISSAVGGSFERLRAAADWRRRGRRGR